MTIKNRRKKTTLSDGGVVAPACHPSDVTRKEAPRIFEKILPALLFVVLFLAIFYPLVFGDRQFCYRDSGFFYYPLYAQIQQRLDAGELPLWDPCENLGQPLLANPTSAVFYPGKLIFFLPRFLPVDYGFCFKWFILIHFPIAFFGMERLARQWRLTRPAATLSAVSFAFGGSVLIQYCNPVYLVGAAWLPWALAAGDRLLTRPNGTDAAFLAIFLAFMTVGGDPETAYLTGLLLLSLAVFRRYSGRKKAAMDPSEEERSESISPPLFRRALIYLISSGILAGFLSAAAILPAAGAGKVSDRETAACPSLWDIPGALSRRDGPIADGLLCRDIQNKGHAEATWNFSVPPWRLPEFLWPKFSGSFTPAPTRWSRAWSNVTDDWSISLSFGIIPLILAIGAALPRNRQLGPVESRREPLFPNAIRLWAIFSGGFLLLGALGGFGPGWVVRLFRSIGGDSFDPRVLPGDPVGGVYWLMNLLLPKFALFRYPAKLMTVAALPLATLAGFGWDAYLHRKRTVFLTALTLLLSILGWGAVLLFGRSFLSASLTAESAFFGSIDIVGLTQTVIQNAFLQTTIIAALFLVLRRFAAKRQTTFFWILLLVAADLFVTHLDAVPTLPRERRDEELLLLREIQSQKAVGNDSDGEPPVRVYRDIHRDPFEKNISSNRLGDMATWDRRSLAAKYPFSQNVGIIGGNHGSFLSSELASELETLEAVLNTDPRENPGRNREIENKIAKLGGQFVVGNQDRVGRWPSEAFRPITNQKPTPTSQKDLLDRAEYYLYNDWPFMVDFWQTVRPPSRVRIERSGGKTADGEYVRICRFAPERLTLEARLLSPGTIVLAEQFWPGWNAEARELTNESAPPVRLDVIPTDGFLRSARLDAGTWRVEMTYRPREVYSGIRISIAAWTLLALSLIVQGGDRWRKKRKAES